VDIPIQNVYYLLCYAWDRLEERDIVNVDADGSADVLNLLAAPRTFASAASTEGTCYIMSGQAI